MRMGECVYWLNNLNKQHPLTSFVIVTDPMLSGEELLMKPFTAVSKLKTYRSPIDHNLTS